MTSGLKKMLAQGIANEQEELKKAMNQNTTDMPENADKTIAPVKKEIVPSEKKRKTTKTKINRHTESDKNKGGRPSNTEKGLASRKQYSLTLKEEDYREFLRIAGEENTSFAKFMEKAAKEYIKKHY